MGSLAVECFFMRFCSGLVVVVCWGLCRCFSDFCFLVGVFFFVACVCVFRVGSVRFVVFVLLIGWVGFGLFGVLDMGLLKLF